MLFFFNDTATTEIYTLSLHDALPISGELLEANAEEIKGWLARESGAIQPFGDFQVHTSAQECYEASALPSHPYGELLRTGAPRLSFARRVPAGVVGVIAPFNVPTILAIRARSEEHTSEL